MPHSIRYSPDRYHAVHPATVRPPSPEVSPIRQNWFRHAIQLKEWHPDSRKSESPLILPLHLRVPVPGRKKHLLSGLPPPPWKSNWSLCSAFAFLHIRSPLSP